MKAKYIIFDLDDTLMYEIEYLKSAYRAIAEILDSDKKEALFHEMIALYNAEEDVFNVLVGMYPDYSKNSLLDIYRNHFPNIRLNNEVEYLLNYCKKSNYKLGLITDGRSITQRNKLKALGIENLFDKIIISEELGSSKPDERNFTFFLEEQACEYFYIADNVKKDFITPNKLGWTTVCLLDSGKNIHPQNFNISEEYLPKFRINKIIELKILIQNTNSII